MTTIYITTAIPYVNAPPHIGHALELVQVDALARAYRSDGAQVRTLTGTDDNAAKNIQAAVAAGVPVGEFVRTTGNRFLNLFDPLGVAFDDVIRTASDPRHAVGVRRLWEACAAAGDLYVKDYTGRYCTGCEAFLDEADLGPNGVCGEHGVVPETVTEQNWFFRLSRHTERLRDAITSGELRIEPVVRRNEVLAALDAGLRDISVSRPASRSDGWGIAVPGDPSQIIYVWFDALANYLTALGNGGDEATWWDGSDERIHVIGKGIIRFHALYWPAILASAGLKLPTALYVHDYLTVDGAKISKSLGNTIEPGGLVDEFGTDTLRWWLLAGSPLGADADFTVARLVARGNEDLANGFGNLVTRTVGLCARLRDGVIPETTPPPRDDEFFAALDAFDLRRAVRRIRELIAAANLLIEQVKPWELAKADKRDPAIDAVLTDVIGCCRHLTALIAAFVPGTASRAAGRLAGDADAGVVFARIVPAA